MNRFIELDLLLTEIIESEVRYGHCLRQMIENLLVPSRQRDDIFTVEQLDTLFCNIELIASIQEMMQRMFLRAMHFLLLQAD